MGRRRCSPRRISDRSRERIARAPLPSQRRARTPPRSCPGPACCTPFVCVWSVGRAVLADQEVLAAVVLQQLPVLFEKRARERQQFERHRPLSLQLDLALGYGEGEVEL